MVTTGLFLSLFICFNLFAQVDTRQVAIESKDKFVLKAMYYASGKEGPGILLLHQCDRRGKLTGYEELAVKLASAGFNVLVPDSRGYGESRNERYHDFHSQMSLIEPIVPADMEAIYQFLSAHNDIDKTRIGLVGASCGARNAIRLAAEHPEIRTLVLISGAFNTGGPIAKGYDKLTDLPVLSIYSEEDRYGTPAAMRHTFENSRNDSSKLLVYKGDKHGTPLFVHDTNLEQEILMWFLTHLQPK